ncbi:MAG: aminotransferase class V-fold PLP-dependent enzyme [Balneolaceae bacterium]|nr:aminotransferase class V-fold PLP-dependent enzyme [Balneolaceae bacterium]
MKLISTNNNQNTISPVGVTGANTPTPLATGETTRYINLDNSASTPALQSVTDFIHDFLPYYSSVHRGSGIKSRISTQLYEDAHEIVARFVGASTKDNTVIFTKNTTEAINKLSYRFPFTDDAIVLSTGMEHHSNDLPWRNKAKTIHLRTTPSGKLDLGDLKEKLEQYAPNIALVCISGASNVTGLIQPIYNIARMAHRAGAKVLVDAAQLAPHRSIDIRPNGHPEHIDFLALSAHKMYAPFGTGALIAPKDLFLNSAPEYCGGGTVQSVTLDDVVWAGLPDREEAGSPNVIGAVALAKAITELEKMGMHQIASHEMQLTHYALEELQKIDRVTLYGDLKAERVGVVSYNAEGISHFKLAAVLSHEYGIGVRNGCFCAHPYVVSLLDLGEEEITAWKKQLQRGEKSNMPGLVRISFGCYNTVDDVQTFVSALKDILRHGPNLDYTQNKNTGEFSPVNLAKDSTEQFLKVCGLGYH